MSRARKLVSMREGAYGEGLSKAALKEVTVTLLVDGEYNDG
jgi:hypothetical protein